MGLEIKRNRKGEYQLKSSISDEIIHEDKWIDEHETKKVLLNRMFFRFMDEAIKLDMTFPDGYQVNGKIQRGKSNKYFDWAFDKENGGMNEEVYDAKMKEILEIIGFENIE